VYYVFLRADDEAQPRSHPDRALDKMKRTRRRSDRHRRAKAGAEEGRSTRRRRRRSRKPAANELSSTEGIRERIRRVRMPNASEADLFWSPGGRNSPSAPEEKRNPASTPLTRSSPTPSW
jgi:hypothetical protein